jgi:hypothetical protein
LDQVEDVLMGNEIDKLGPKDFIIGCLVVILVLIVVPILILIFKISIYFAIVIGIILAIILGIALLGRVIRLIFFRNRSVDEKNTDVKTYNLKQ